MLTCGVKGGYDAGIQVTSFGGFGCAVRYGAASGYGRGPEQLIPHREREREREIEKEKEIEREGDNAREGDREKERERERGREGEKERGSESC